MDILPHNEVTWVIGVCVMGRKARSPALIKILNHLKNTGLFDIVVFPEVDILGKSVEEWPKCDFLISFYSTGFPINKAIEYTELWKPFHLNNLPMQVFLQDRRLLLHLLDINNVPTLRRLVTQRHGPPHIENEVKKIFKEKGMSIPEFSDEYIDVEVVDEDTLKIGHGIIKKPFVEKPVSAEDHNVYVYYPKAQGGGVRKLYRKTFDKCSDFERNTTYPRIDKDYIYEEFVNMDDGKDIKFYVVGKALIHAESRKSPVVDGVVLRDACGREIRTRIEPTELEREISTIICEIFGQTVCGFDVLRVNRSPYIADVNSWSLVRSESDYHYKCANALKDYFFSFLSRTNLPNLRNSRIKKKCKLSEYISTISYIDKCNNDMELYFNDEGVPLLLNFLNGDFKSKNSSDIESLINACDKILSEQYFESLSKIKSLIEQNRLCYPGIEVRIKENGYNSMENREQILLTIRRGI